MFFKNPNKQRELFLKDEYMSHLNNVEFQKVMKAIFQNFGDTLIINNRAHPPKFYPLTSRFTLLGTRSSSQIRNDRLDFFWSGDLAICDLAIS